MGQHLAVPGRLVAENKELVPALGETEVEGEQAATEEQPDRWLDVHGHRAGDQAEEEEGRNGEHIEQHQVLDRLRVGNVQGQVAPDACQGGQPHDPAEREGERGQQCRSRHGASGADPARGHWPVPFDRVGTILGTIDHVVERVDRAGGEAEGHEDQDRVHHHGRFGGPSREEQGGQDEHVLGPVLRAQQFQPVARSRAPAGGLNGHRAAHGGGHSVST